MDGWLIDITPSGIRTLVQRSPPKKGQQLCLCAERTDLPDVFRLSDDKEELKVIFLRSAREKLVDSLGNGPFSKALVGIRDVIVGNADRILNDDPLVLVADLEIVVPERNGQEGPPKTQWKWIKPKNGQLPRVRGGLICTFLKEWAPFLSNEELAGSGVWSRALSPVTSLRKDMETVSAFLEHHSAIQTLHRSQSGGLGTGSSENIMTTSYFAALKSFEEAQMDRQKVSLTSNAGRETVVGAARVVDQYKKCLEVALSCPTTDFLSVDMLCEWHKGRFIPVHKFAGCTPRHLLRSSSFFSFKVLCGEGIHPDAGNLRHKWVNVGQTSFRCPEDVQRDLQDVCIAIRVLESRLLRNMARNKDRGLFLATFAAVVLMGIVDVHPFADGNGRLSKIAVNWALRRVGLPFVVHLFATPAQYFQFTKSIRLTRRNIVLHSKGQVTQDQLLDGYRSAGALFPLVQLILDRLGKTVAEFQKVVQEKLSQMSEEDESRAARRYRERAAQGNCLICFGDNPNIATLCCGKAVHLVSYLVAPFR